MTQTEAARHNSVRAVIPGLYFAVSVLVSVRLAMPGEEASENS